jgi:hypothetical protein
LELLSDFTISYWLNPDTLPTNLNDYTSILSKNSYGVGGWIAGVWRSSDNVIAFQREGAYSNKLYGDVNHPISLNDWQNITVTYNSSADSLKYYLNGALVSTIINTGFQIIANNFDLNIGAQKQDLSYVKLFNGKLDDIGIWNRALTQSEITALYTSTSTGINDIKNLNIKIYPNPTNNIINIEGLTKNENNAIQIFDVQGKLVITKKINEKGIIDLSELNKGVYVIKVGEVAQRILKM